MARWERTHCAFLPHALPLLRVRVYAPSCLASYHVPGLLASPSILLSSCESDPFFSVCSNTRNRNLACVALTLLSREYRAMVCSQLFHSLNQVATILARSQKAEDLIAGQSRTAAKSLHSSSGGRGGGEEW